MKFLVWSTIACVVSFTLCGVFSGYADFKNIEKKFGSKFNFSYSGINAEENREFGERKEVFEISKLKKIEINSSISEVNVESKNVEKIQIIVKFLNEEVEETYKSELKDGILKIDTGEEGDNHGFSSFFGSKKNGCKIRIVIPKGFELDYEFKLALGSLEMENLKIGSFDAKLAAGNIEIEDSSFKSAIVKAAAGNIELEGVTVLEEMEIKAAAGNVKIEFSQADPNVKIKSAAGNIYLSFDGDIEPNLTFESLSTVGDLSARKDFKKKEGSVYTYGEGKGRIEVKSTFGSVRLK